MHTSAELIPRIKRVMTPFPYSISGEKGLADAQEMMRSHNIRHLPVTKDGALVGVLQWAGLRMAQSLANADNPVTVGEVCTREPYVVDLNTPLDEVAETMADRRASVALVTRAGKLCGILTSTDVCRLLAETLRSMNPPDEVA